MLPDEIRISARSVSNAIDTGAAGARGHDRVGAGLHAQAGAVGGKSRLRCRVTILFVAILNQIELGACMVGQTDSHTFAVRRSLGSDARLTTAAGCRVE